MKKTRVVVVLLTVAVLTVVSCGRKGTGCPTFSKTTTEQNIDKKA